MPSVQQQAMTAGIVSVGVGLERMRRRRFTQQRPVDVIGDQTSSSSSNSSWQGGHTPPMPRHISRQRRRGAVKQ